MRNKLNLRNKIVLGLALSAALVQGTVPLTNERVRRLGDQMQCKCGCYASITGCNMINCHFSDPVRTQLLKLVDEGKSDDAIIADMVAAYGKDILLKPPAEGFYLLSWLMPFVWISGGLGAIYLVLRSYLKKRPAAEGPGQIVVESADLARYRDRIDKDLSDLE
ncbi:MAG: cytochrome c-type biogenesis protein CcmH [Acidobacteria bacterium]|jgi:cytochrome c-type biogenesis protein CcmH|nr:cytochrome c-type biogenesis protein CcmH [Acidobacteriota bacterium]